MGFTEYRVPIKAAKILIISCLCSLTVHGAWAEEKPPAQPASAWSVKTEFGGFDITLSPDAAQVSGLAVRLAGFSCGPVCVTGSMEAESRDMWPIENNCFHARTNIGIYDLVLTGTIDKTGKSACGTWSINAAGTICTGSWETD